MSVTDKTTEQSAISFEAWPQSWRAQLLREPPLIAPASQFTYPLQIAGEEDALARGALQLLVHPASGGTFLATFALGFASASIPSGFFACPNPDQLCAVAGGYTYIVDTLHPERSTHLSLKPVVEVRALAAHALLLFVGFHTLLAWGKGGIVWETSRLSWEGIRLADVETDTLTGFGWNMQSDKEVAFTVDLRTGQHLGGGY